jgi:hypothetical protein
VGVGVGTGVEVALPDNWTRSSTLFAAAFLELNSYPSLLALSIASDKNDPLAEATVEVRSTSFQTEITPPGVKVVIGAPVAGLLP